MDDFGELTYDTTIYKKRAFMNGGGVWSTGSCTYQVRKLVSETVVDVPSVYPSSSRILGTQVIQTASGSMSCGRSRKGTDMNQSLHQSISIFIDKTALKEEST